MNILEKIYTHSTLNKEEYLLTYIPQLDYMLRFPSEGFVQILDTNTSMGKTSIGLYLAKSFCLQEKNVLYIDIDQNINSNILINRGLENVSGLGFLSSGNPEEILDLIVETEPEVIIFDSLPSISSEDFKDLRIFLNKLPKDKLYIILNQKRTKFRKSFLSGYSDLTLLDYCKLNIHLTNSFLINKEYKPVGYKIITQVINQGNCNLYMFFDTGIDYNYNLLKFSVSKNWVVKKGNHFYYQDKYLGNSYYSIISPEINNELYKKILLSKT